MDFDSPDVMKDFPGLYSTDINKKFNSSDYNNENDKSSKKDMLISKRKDKKDKKDKEKGYAALEGESSDEASPSKSKKSKHFKFSKSKDKEKREKDTGEKRPKKSEKKLVKEKTKKGHKHASDIAEALPIFGVSLDVAVERSRCHDGLDIPLPLRECIDYVESMGLAFEGVYKISGAKAKVSQIRKMYNHRENVDLNEYEIPTATSLLKMFLRDLPEPIFTNDLIIRFEEAGAILNLNTREKHLRCLVDSLPHFNKLVLCWVIVHLNNVSLKEHLNKMSKQNLASALNHTFHISSRLLQALLCHCQALFPDIVIYKYIPPLESGAQLPDRPNLIDVELRKQESLLNQIHNEMNYGQISKQREELLWEVQRIITQLKRKMKNYQKSKEQVPQSEKCEAAANYDQMEPEEPANKNCEESESNIVSESVPTTLEEPSDFEQIQDDVNKYENTNADTTKIDKSSLLNEPGTSKSNNKKYSEVDDDEDCSWESEDTSTDSEILEEQLYFDERLITLRLKNCLLKELADHLKEEISTLECEIEEMNNKVKSSSRKFIRRKPVKSAESFQEIRDLLEKENQMLQIKKMNLVRHIIEEREMCIDLTARLKWAQKETKEQKFLQLQNVIKD